MVDMTQDNTPAAPGNPHFHTAMQRIRTAQSRHDAVAVAGAAQGEATLAMAYEQRTANLMAARADLQHRTSRRDIALYESLTIQINARLGLGTEQEPTEAQEPEAPSDPESIRAGFSRAYFYDVDEIDNAEERWMRVGKGNRGDQNAVVLSTPRAQHLVIAQENAPALAAAILMSVGLDPATTVLPTEVPQSV